MTDSERTLSERLRVYVFDRLIEDRSSPLLARVDAVAREAVAAQLAQQRAEMERDIGDRLRAEISQHFGQKVANLERVVDEALQKIDKKRSDSLPREIKELPQRVAELRADFHAGFERLSADGGYADGDTVDRSFELNRPHPQTFAPGGLGQDKRPRIPKWSIGLVAAAAVVMGLWGFTTSPIFQRIVEGRAPEAHAPATPQGGAPGVPELRGAIGDRTSAGLQRVLASTPRMSAELAVNGSLRRAVCGLVDEGCVPAQLGELQRNALFQASVEMLATVYGCPGEALDVDGQLGAGTVTRFGAVSTCAGEKLRAEATSCDDGVACYAPPVGDKPERASVDTATVWMLEVLGMQRR